MQCSVFIHKIYTFSQKRHTKELVDFDNKYWVCGASLINTFATAHVNARHFDF